MVNSFEGLSIKYKSDLEKTRKGYLSKKQIKAEKPTLQRAQEQLAEKYKKEKKELIKKKVEGFGRSFVSLLTSRGKHTILKKPTAKVPSVDPKKFITSGLQRQSLVKEGKTGYIDEEMMEEKIKWLG